MGSSDRTSPDTRMRVILCLSVVTLATAQNEGFFSGITGTINNLFGGSGGNGRRPPPPRPQQQFNRQPAAPAFQPQQQQQQQQQQFNPPRPQPGNRAKDEGHPETCLGVLNNFYADGIKWHDVACHHKKPTVCEPQN